MPSSRPTLVGVAERAGVSIASVSRVLNGQPASEHMLERVNDAVRHLGYRPNAMARSLKIRRTHQLAFGVPDVGNPVYVAMMRGIEDETRARGYRLLVSSTGGDPGETLDLVDGLASGFADGLVLCSVRVDDALVEAVQAAGVPAVVIGTLPRGAALDNVRANSPGGVRAAVEHLHAQGRRRLALVNGPTDTVPGHARGRAFERAVRALGPGAEPWQVVEADDFTLDAGRRAAERLLADGVPDAVLGANDLLAIASMQVLSARGLDVPRDVAVVGMDDTELAGVTSPSLTSVDLGAVERGRRAARLLLERIDDPGLDARRVTVQPRLNVRGSSAAVERAA